MTVFSAFAKETVRCELVRSDVDDYGGTNRVENIKEEKELSERGTVEMYFASSDKRFTFEVLGFTGRALDHEQIIVHVTDFKKRSGSVFTSYGSQTAFAITDASPMYGMFQVIHGSCKFSTK